MKNDLVAIVLAAGQGTRMKSELPKVLHPVFGRPMLDFVLDAIEQAGAKRIIAIVGHGGEQVAQHVGARAECLTQSERLGTAHAVLQAKEALAGFKGKALIVCGDTPLLSSETLRAVVEHERVGQCPGVVLATKMSDPHGYGRLLRDTQGRVRRIVEHKDATGVEKQIQEINTGVYCIECPALFEILELVKNDNTQGEYYLTDIVELFADQGTPIDAVIRGDPNESLGINSPKQLAQAGRLLRLRALDEFMAQGAIILDPETTHIDREATLGADVIIHPQTAIRGASHIVDRAEIGPGSEIRDSLIGAGARVVYSWVQSAKVGQNARIGPYSRIHPGAIVEAGAVIESFTEIKPASQDTQS